MIWFTEQIKLQFAEKKIEEQINAKFCINDYLLILIKLIVPKWYLHKGYI